MIADQLRTVIENLLGNNQDPFPEIEGQENLKKQILSALIAGRNIIIEGYPGVGKTTIAKAVAKLLPNIQAVKGCPFHCDPSNPICPKCKSDARDKNDIEINGLHRFIRIQGSPDLTVEDLLGDIDPALAFEYGPTDPRAFKPGKLLRANRGVLFFDELNRCPERLQNALLQVLEEGEATIGGYTVSYPANFILIATMNPSEFAGTERLSDVLLDRFDVVRMNYPENAAVEREIIRKNAKQLLPVPDNVLTTLVSIVRATRNDDRIESPAGVRATIGLYERSQALAILKKKKFVEIDDVKEVAVSVISHRIKLTPKVRHTQKPQDVVNQIIEEVISGSGPPKLTTGSVVTGMVNNGIQSLDSSHIARMLINNVVD
jgi:magnesium chelatase subunit I